jgi:hypothetical protein
MFRRRLRIGRIRSQWRPCRGALPARTAPRRHRHTCGGTSCRPRCWAAGSTGMLTPSRCPGSRDSPRAASRPYVTPAAPRTPLPPRRFLPVSDRRCLGHRARHRPAPGRSATCRRIVSPPPPRRRAPGHRVRAGQILARMPGRRKRKVRVRGGRCSSRHSRPHRRPWLYPRRRPWPRRASPRFRHPRPRRQPQPHRVRPDRRPPPCPHPAVRQGTPGRPTRTGSNRATVLWSPHRLTGSSTRPGGVIASRACW